MTKRPNHPVEPLSELTWQRIEHNLFAKLALPATLPTVQKPRHAPWKWAVLASAACLLLTAAAVLRSRPNSGNPFATEYLRATEQARELQVGDVHVRIDPGSELVAVHGPGRSLLLVLEHGAARFAVPHRTQPDALVVAAGDTRVEVVGTQFRVARSGASAQVETYEGTVRVVRAGESRLVTRGQRWPEPPAAQPSARENEGAVADAGAVAPPTTELDTSHRTASAASAARPSDSHDRQQQRYEQAAAREVTDPNQARHIYEALARESGPWAGNALYALARLELELKHYGPAARQLRRYLERYPHGTNVLDARSLLARIATEHATEAR